MYGDIRGLRKRGIIGPWPCDSCKQLTQYADVGSETNYIFCRNPGCEFERIVDKRRSIIKESDGTFWRFDTDGNKTRIRAQ